MLAKLRRDGAREEGFTLIELLVVILIIGILAAIAIPSFLNQKGKASDASAKELARTAETVADTIATDNGGSDYSLVTPTTINSYEQTVQACGSGVTPAAPPSSDACLYTASGGSGTFAVTALSTTGNQYTITRASTGATTRTCTATSSTQSTAGGCKLTSGSTGTW